jgi:hypothetical protein
MKLVQVSNFNWHVEYMGNVIFGGSLLAATRYLMNNWGVEADEVSFALQCLTKTGDRAASFGVNVKFVTTLSA